MTCQCCEEPEANSGQMGYPTCGLALGLRTRPWGQDGTPCRHQAMTSGRRTEDDHFGGGARMALTDEVAYMTATELATRIRRRELSPVEVVDACIEQSRPETTA